MNPRLTLLVFLFAAATLSAQRTITFDPEKDLVAHRNYMGIVELIAPAKILVASVQEGTANISEVLSFGVIRIGKSHFLEISALENSKERIHLHIIVLLAETSAGQFQADNLVVTCRSNGECRECASPPNCTCINGGGSCGQNTSMVGALKKVTVTLDD